MSIAITIGVVLSLVRRDDIVFRIFFSNPEAPFSLVRRDDIVFRIFFSNPEAPSLASSPSLRDNISENSEFSEMLSRREGGREKKFHSMTIVIA